MAKTKHAKITRSPLVAIVEDDAALRDATAALLRAAGYGSRSVPTAQQFLRSRLGRRARCLILDMQLPDMTGLELLERMVQRRIGVPTILVTAAADPDGELRANARRAGALTTLHKPFDAEEMLAAVRAAVGAKRR